MEQFGVVINRVCVQPNHQHLKTYCPILGGFSPISGSLPPVDLFLPLYPGLRLVRSFPREEVLPPPGEVMNEFRIRWCPSLCSNRIPACF